MPIKKRSKEERAKSAAKVREAIYTTTPSHGKPGSWGKVPGTFTEEALEPELEIVAIIEETPAEAVPEVEEQLEESQEETVQEEAVEPIVEEAVVEEPVEEAKVEPIVPEPERSLEEIAELERNKAEIKTLKAKLKELGEK